MKDIEKTKYEGHYKKLTFYQDFFILFIFFCQNFITLFFYQSRAVLVFHIIYLLIFYYY